MCKAFLMCLMEQKQIVVSSIPSDALTAIDLCSGPGGVTTGYNAAGVRVIAAVDTDGNARSTYSSNHPEVLLLADDLAVLEPERLLALVGLARRELDVLTACVPCQTFSTLSRGSRRDQDPTNRLVERVADFAELLLPRAVVMENVPPLQGDRRFRRLVARLRAAGYGVRHSVVDAADFAVPQRRRRLVMIALRDRVDEEVPRFEPDHPLLGRFRRRRTVRDAFRRLRHAKRDDPLARHRGKYPAKVARRIAAVPKNGGSRTSLPADLQLACHARTGSSVAVNVYGRMALDDVAPTLTTRCTTPACGRFLHPYANRAITLREAAVLQTFPVDYHFEGGSMAMQAQIGNAVPPSLAEAIAIVLRDALETTPSRVERKKPVPAPPASSPQTRVRMQAVGRRDTPPELALRSLLHGRGRRFRVDRAPIKGLRRKADVVFGPAKVAVFVDGCFWHGCPTHGTVPRTNRAWWEKKLAATRERDADTDRRLEQAGWTPVRIWEHEDAAEAADRIEAMLRTTGHSARTGPNVADQGATDASRQTLRTDVARE